MKRIAKPMKPGSFARVKCNGYTYVLWIHDQILDNGARNAMRRHAWALNAAFEAAHAERCAACPTVQALAIAERRDGRFCGKCLLRIDAERALRKAGILGPKLATKRAKRKSK